MFASKVSFAWMVITAIVISGCSNNQVKAKLSRQTTQAAEPPLNLNSVPKAIVDVGEYAENAYDAALAGNWTRVDAKVQSLRTSAAKLEKGGQSSGQSDIETSISELEQSAAIHNKIRTMKVANEITRLAAEMSSHYRLVVPVQVVLLDYDGRELRIDSMDGDLAGARRMASKIQSDWNLVRPKVQAQGGDEASRFNRLVDQIQNAKTKKTFAQLANQELNEVDFLEHLCSRSNVISTPLPPVELRFVLREVTGRNTTLYVLRFPICECRGRKRIEVSQSSYVYVLRLRPVILRFVSRISLLWPPFLPVVRFRTRRSAPFSGSCLGLLIWVQ